ncbi:MAG: prepilin-type N-terminal cleavage/methylation domain-containing protein [Pirellulales bacterium]|nr:prepilin-type N-terminal cleavage/methylation domain-containing protein [Pirellulales bacterium]
MRNSKAFTLVELVVVVLILGILSAVAVPRLLGTTAIATDNGLRHTLSIVRDAIERYAADYHGALPGADKNEKTFKADLVPYLRKFPANPVGADPKKQDEVAIQNAGIPLASQIDNKEGWMYDNLMGEFRANNNEFSNDGVTRYSEF